MSDDLVAWLRAQLDDDERAALAVSDGPNKPEKWTARQYKDGIRNWRVDGQHSCVVDGAFQHDAEHMARHDPDRVLREVEAKRRIIDWVVAQQVPNGTIGDDFLYPLVALAAAYADRPGYREDWRP